MSYRVSLLPEARKDLDAMPAAVREQTVKQLRVLADNPTALSRRSRFPFIERCQLYTFDCDHELQRWEINVLFQYGADEQTIHVLMIGRAVWDLGDGIDPA